MYKLKECLNFHDKNMLLKKSITKLGLLEHLFIFFIFVKQLLIYFFSIFMNTLFF